MNTVIYIYRMNDAGEVSEEAAEAVKTAKTYKSPDGYSFPGTAKRRFTHDEMNRVDGFLHLFYASETRDMEAAKAAFRDYFKFHHERAKAEAERWEQRMNSVH